MNFGTINSSQSSLQKRGLNGLVRTEASVGLYFGPGTPMSTLGPVRIGSGVERIKHNTHRIQAPYYRQVLDREPPVLSALPQHVKGSTAQLSTRNVHPPIQHRGTAIVGGTYLAPIPELPSRENAFDSNAPPQPRTCERPSSKLPLASATNALTLGKPRTMMAPGEGTGYLYPSHSMPISPTTLYNTPLQDCFPSLSNITANGRTAPVAVDSSSWCGSQLDTTSSSYPLSKSTNDSIITMTDTSPVTAMNECNDIIPAGLLFVDKLMGQKTRALQTESSSDTDTNTSNSDQFTPCDQAPEKALSLQIIFDISYGTMKYWDVSLPVSTFKYAGGRLPSCIYSYYAMKPARSSLEIVVSIGANTIPSSPGATENRDQVTNTALHSHSIHISAKPFVSPMEVINDKPGKFEYKFVLSVFSVLEGLHKGLNERLSATHWKTLSIEEKLFLVKALCMRRSGRLFPADIAALDEAKARVVSVCKETSPSETRVVHAMLDAYAFPSAVRTSLGV